MADEVVTTSCDSCEDDDAEEGGRPAAAECIACRRSAPGAPALFRGLIRKGPGEGATIGIGLAIEMSSQYGALSNSSGEPILIRCPSAAGRVAKIAFCFAGVFSRPDHPKAAA